MKKGFSVVSVAIIIALLAAAWIVYSVLQQPRKLDGDNIMLMRTYVERDVSKCALIKFSCVPGTVPFSDATGCGCETLSEGPNQVPVAIDGGSSQFSGTVLAGTFAPLLDFGRSDYDAALQSGKLVILYFYADWCPICKVEFPKMQAAFNELTSENVIGFRVNYKDSSTDKDEEALARQFGIPYQHTKVFLKNGKQVLKAPDSWSIERYRSEIAKYLE